MRCARWFAVAVVLVSLGTAEAAEPAEPASDKVWLEIMARAAVLEEKPAVRQRAIEELRQAGPAGLEALETVHAESLAALRAAGQNPLTVLLVPEGSNSGEVASVDSQLQQRLTAAFTQVAAQRGAHLSGLYWYTDMDEAVRAARKSKRPILSLRLLGKLTDEYSCANSRFFRTTLYTNSQVAQILREKFVLHWSSERPVPVVTVDFGDGRTLKRTLTGNSVHYLLSPEGLPVDALPGLYGPQAFIRWLDRAGQVAGSNGLRSPWGGAFVLKRYHLERIDELAKEWAADLERAGNPVSADMDADRTAFFEKLQAATSEEHWLQLAALHAGDAQLDAASQALIRRENPQAFQALPAMALTVSKAFVERPLLPPVIARLQSSIAEDTVRNEYLLHRRIHHWFAYEQPDRFDLAGLNQRVYSELFLTPASDPWLGLVQPDTYTALENGGVVTAGRQ